MLVLRRKDGEWVEVTHRSGDVLRIRLCDVGRQFAGRASLVFDDPARNFAIWRPEAPRLRATGPVPADPPPSRA